MMFTHDTRANLAMAAALVNTARRRDGTDALSTVEDLDLFYDEHGFSGRHDGDDAELVCVRTVRTRLGGLWLLGRDDAAAEVNAMLATSDAVLQLVRHDGLDWHLHATPRHAPLSTQMLVDAALGVLELVRADEWGRMATCEAEDCDAVIVDLSRNRSRRFCDVNNCANRAHVAAYRARRAADDGPAAEP